jgi:hypothetical protein
VVFSFKRCITSAIKHHNPDVGARRAVPRLGEARLAPTIDMFNCFRNTPILKYLLQSLPKGIVFREYCFLPFCRMGNGGRTVAQLGCYLYSLYPIMPDCKETDDRFGPAYASLGISGQALVYFSANLFPKQGGYDVSQDLPGFWKPGRSTMQIEYRRSA